MYVQMQTNAFQNAFLIQNTGQAVSWQNVITGAYIQPHGQYVFDL
jgi:hypothetical protein